MLKVKIKRKKMAKRSISVKLRKKKIIVRIIKHNTSFEVC